MGQMKEVYMRMLRENPQHVKDMESEFEFEAWYAQVRYQGVVAFGTDAAGEIVMLHEYSVEKLYKIAADNQITGTLELIFPSKIIR
jgi:hypothetical protein